MNNWNVYIHIFPNNKKYIGITNQNPEIRWRKDGKGYIKQKVMWAAIQKYGWNNIEHKVLYTNLSQEEAENKEKELIKLFESTTWMGEGYNVQEGGDSRIIINREEVINLWKEGKAALEISKILECNISSVLYILDSMNISKEERKKRQQKASGEATKESCGIKVNQFDLEHNFITTYKSIQDARKAVNANNQYYIKSCCEGKVSRAHGYLWQYYKEENVLNGVPQWDSKIKMKQTQLRRVIQYDLNMNELARYNSISDAIKAIGKTPGKFSGISSVCAGKQKTAGGYIWKYEDSVS